MSPTVFVAELRRRLGLERLDPELLLEEVVTLVELGRTSPVGEVARVLEAVRAEVLDTFETVLRTELGYSPRSAHRARKLTEAQLAKLDAETLNALGDNA